MTNIIKYENRPFIDTFEMDEAMIDGWNSVVKPNDIIYHLGDVFLCDFQRQKEIANRLNGYKILRLGNHDRQGIGKFKELGFSEVFKRDISFDGFIASHYPIIGTELPNVHGHVHSKISHLDQRIYKCVSVELIDYKPIHLDEIVAWVKNF